MHANLDAVGSRDRHRFQSVPLVTRIEWAIERGPVSAEATHPSTMTGPGTNASTPASAAVKIATAKGQQHVHSRRGDRRLAHRPGTR